MEYMIPFESFAFVTTEKLNGAALLENCFCICDSTGERMSDIDKNSEALSLIRNSGFALPLRELLLLPCINGFISGLRG